MALNKKQMTLLNAIATGTMTHVAKTAEAAALVSGGYMEVNTEQLDAAGNALVRLTDKGKTMVATPTTATNGAAPVFGLIKGVVLPESKRGFAKGAGAPTIYPFEKMEVNDTFFVPVSEKHPNPVKTLGSTVSSQNHRFSEETGEVKQVERAKRGKKNKAVLDANGQKIMETVTVKVRKPVRKFSIRPVQKGVAYGTWTAPADGALIARVM